MSGKWPGPVTFNDDDPKRGFVTIFLSVPELKAKRTVPLVGKYEPTNGTVNPTFEKGLIEVVIKAAEEEYTYRKQLPEDIDPSKTTHEVKKGQVILNLAKAEQAPWAEHAKFFTTKN